MKLRNIHHEWEMFNLLSLLTFFIILSSLSSQYTISMFLFFVTKKVLISKERRTLAPY
jgi:hypothetical protein